jgi:hypothetical protein
MKTVAVTILLVALYLLYRIAFPKQPDKPESRRSNDTLQKKQVDVSEAVIKSRYVLPDRRNLTQTAAIQ